MLVSAPSTLEYRVPMSRPRILYIMGSLAANDLGEEVVAILGRLPRDSFEPHVAALSGREELRDRITELDVPIHSLELVGAFGTLQAVGKVRELIKEVRADLVHGFGSWGGAVAGLAAPPDVAVVRNVTRAPNHEKDLRGRLLRHLEGRARGRHAIRYIVPNSGSRGLALRAYGAADGHVEVLPTSIDVTGIRDRVKAIGRKAAREALGLEDHHTAFALLSNFDSGAGMDRILTGLALAHAEVPDMRMFVVGSGRYEGSTRWKADELGLSEAVAFVGRGSEADPIWAAADIAIDAAPWASWSRPALVAIAAGLPTLKMQSGVGGWSEEMGENLPMVSGEPEPFARDLIGLSSDEALRKDILDHGARISAEVDVANVVERLSELYASIIDR